MLNYHRLTSAAVILLAAAAVSQLKAHDFNEDKTTMTFNTSVEISGKALAAGTYVFKTLPSDRDLVMVMDSTDSHLMAIVPARPIVSQTISDETRVEFSENTANSPETVHAWFYPGRSEGWEFLPARSGSMAVPQPGQ